MKKLLTSLLCLGLLLVGCSSTEEEEKSVDESFIIDMSNGLQARWKLNDEDEAKDGYEDIALNSEEWQEMIISYVDAELEYIEDYSEKSFEDSHLQELSNTYINLLNSHKDICSYITVDYSKYSDEYSSIYNERSKIIKELVNDYELTVDETYQSTLDDFITNADLVEADEAKQEEIDELISSITFELESEDYYKTYTAVVENTTNIDFDYFMITINLIDEDGIIVASEYANVDAFHPGSKAKFEFMTDEDFETTEIKEDGWSEAE